ncbi:MAG: DUF397 domain-containing protein [Pseudonocardiaceae bacterium]
MTVPEPAGIIWRTSSYSGEGGDCVQVGWRTSSYSGSGSACVQVAPAPDGVLVRDSKNPEGPALALPPATWRAFLHTLTPSD